MKNYIATYSGKNENETATFSCDTLKIAKRYANAYKRRNIKFQSKTSVKLIKKLV